MNAIKNFFLAFLTSTPCILSAHHIVIENNRGETFVLPVHPDETFRNVVEVLDVFEADEDDFYTFKISKSFISNEMLAKKPRAIARSYAIGITPAEAADIAYILKTLANKSGPAIYLEVSSLEKAGDRINHVHPFFFLSTIFTNEELKVCVKNLKGKCKEGFLDGIVPSLAEENGRNNLMQFVDDFAARVQVDPNEIRPLLQAGKWERFVNFLINGIKPRPGADRYDM
jgi:hypothetical protein